MKARLFVYKPRNIQNFHLTFPAKAPNSIQPTSCNGSVLYVVCCVLSPRHAIFVNRVEEGKNVKTFKKDVKKKLPTKNVKIVKRAQNV